MIYLNLVAKSAGFAEVAEASFFENFRCHLMWTRHRVLEVLQDQDELVVAGSRIRSVADWDKANPHMKRGTGAIGFRIYEMADKAELAVLKSKVAWVMENQRWFSVIDGLDMVGAGLGMHFDHDFIVDGEGGSWDLLNKSWSELPYTRDLVFQMAVGFNVPTLWAAVCQYRTRMDAFSWFMLKDETLPWSGLSVEAALAKCREAFVAAGNPIDGLPNRFELERALRFGV